MEFMKLYIYLFTLSNLNLLQKITVFFSLNFLVCINSVRVLKEPPNIKGNSSSFCFAVWELLSEEAN